MRSTPNSAVLVARKKQGGFALLGVALALMVASAALSIYMWLQWEDLQDNKAVAQGKAMVVAMGALNTYQTLYYDSLMKGTAIAGVADPLKPTVNELKALNVGFPANFSGTALIGGNYNFRVDITPTGCAIPACNMDGVVWIDRPYKDVLKLGRIDAARLGLAINAIGPDGAFSRNETPAQISGYGGKWSGTNPVANTAGILAARTGYASSSMSVYMRRDGSLKPTGNWDFDTKQIDNLGMIQIAEVKTQDSPCTKNGQIARDANGSLLTCQDLVWRAGKSRFWKEPVLTYAALPAGDEVGSVRLTLDTNRAFAWTGSGWTALAVDQSGNITVPGITKTGKLQLNDIVVANTACSPDGLLARDAAGLLLSCQGGAYRILAGGKVKNLWTSVPAQGYVDFLAYIPAADRQSVTGIHVLLQAWTMHNNNAGTDCFGYVDGVQAFPIGFDTSSDNEWRNGSGSVLLSPGAHSISYSCNIGYVSSAIATIDAYW